MPVSRLSLGVQHSAARSRRGRRRSALSIGRRENAATMGVQWREAYRGRITRRNQRLVLAVRGQGHCELRLNAFEGQPTGLRSLASAAAPANHPCPVIEVEAERRERP